MNETSPNTACPRCDNGFTCGMAAGTTHCWCADLPNIIPCDGIPFAGEDQRYEGCLCPNCLRELIGQQATSGT